jgi:hypothetical protein
VILDLAAEVLAQRCDIDGHDSPETSHRLRRYCRWT